MAGTKPNTFPFSRLPSELQRQVLLHTGLVIPFRPIGEVQGLEIFSGQPKYQDSDRLPCCGNCSSWSSVESVDSQPDCRCAYTSDSFSPTCTCQRFPVALLDVGGKVSQLAQEIIFSENRIYLSGDIDKNCIWLRSQPPALLSLLRSLDLIIISGQLRTWGEIKSVTHGHKVPAEWADLAYLIESRLNLPNLTLSIDAAHMYDDLLEDSLIHGDAGKEYWVSLKEVYKALVAPFASRPSFRSLHAFFVFWPLFGATEPDMEKMVMGDEYDGQGKGKIAYSDRDWKLPHGWEWWEMDDETADWNPDYEAYSEELMQDIE